MKILLVANNSAEILTRKKILKACQALGYSLYIASNIKESDLSTLIALRIETFDIDFSPRTKNPLKDLKLYNTYKKICKKVQPDIILSYHIKPNIYCGIVAKMLKIPFIANITGLGTLFEKESILQKLVCSLYKFAFNSNNTFIFFQNNDDKNLFFQKKIIKNENICDVLPGSGVDLSFFNPALMPPSPKKNIIEFSYIGRLVISKGIRLFIEAAKIVSNTHKNCIFNIAGATSQDDADFIPQVELEDACKNKAIKYHGKIKDVRLFLHEKTDCLVFPSYYREGIPRCLLEGAAMAKPLIATDSVGNREPCIDGLNGFLIKKRDLYDLVAKIETFLKLEDSKRIQMGLVSRSIAEERFSDEMVLNKYISKIKEISKT